MLNMNDLTTVTLNIATVRESTSTGFVILFKKNPPHLLMDIDFTNDAERDALYDTFRHLYQENDCYAYSVAAEVWYSPANKVRASEADDKQDALAISVKDSRSEEYKLIMVTQAGITEINDKAQSADITQFDNPYLIATPKRKLRMLAEKIPKDWLDIERMPTHSGDTVRFKKV